MSKGTKHTGGTWELVNYKHTLGKSVGIKKVKGGWIAKLHPFTPDGKGLTEALANAQLMVNSPNLLIATKRLLEVWHEQFGENVCDCRPEPENFWDSCPACFARAVIESAGREVEL